jgi:serine/threonine protein kinase
MAYLEMKNVVHRDLSCKNLLIKEESGNFKIKISDFGLSREVDDFYTSTESRLPVKWTAPEVFRFNKHSAKSDVFSFAITMWEIYELGSIPYPDMDNSTARKKVMEGYRLPCPSLCPPGVFSLMTRCWNEDPEKVRACASLLFFLLFLLSLSLEAACFQRL